MKKIFSISIISVFTLLIFSGTAFGGFWNMSESTIAWSPLKIEEDQFPGTAQVLTAKFTSKKDLENVKFRLTPRLSKYAVVKPESIDKVEKNKEYTVSIIVSLPSDVLSKKYSTKQFDKDFKKYLKKHKDLEKYLKKFSKKKIPGLLFVTSEKTTPWCKFWHKSKKCKERRAIHPKALKIMVRVKEPSVEDIPIDEVSFPILERIYEDEETGAVYVEDEVIIRFEEDVSETRIKEIISSADGRVLGYISDIEIYQVLVPVTDPSELEPIIQQLEAHPEVIIATYHWIYESF